MVVTPAVLREWALPQPGSGKESRGQLLVLGGSRSTPGAVLLAGEAALRAGAGKLVLATVADTTAALAVAVPEAAVVALPRGPGDDLDPACRRAPRDRLESADVVVAGPGLATRTRPATWSPPPRPAWTRRSSSTRSARRTSPSTPRACTTSRAGWC